MTDRAKRRRQAKALRSIHSSSERTSIKQRADMLLASSSRAMQAGNLQLATSGFQEVIQLHPKNVQAIFNLGVILTHQDQHAQALDRFIQAVKFAPKDSNIIANAGYSAFRLGKFDDARKYLKKALRANKRNVLALSAMGKVLRAVQDFGTAQAYLEKALVVDPKFVPAYIDLAEVCSEIGDLNRVREVLEKALSYFPKNVLVLNKAAVLYRAMGILEKSEKCLRELIRLEPDSPSAYSLLMDVTKIASDSDPVFVSALKLFDALPDKMVDKQSENFSRGHVIVNPKAQLAIEIGSVYERQQQYKKAFSYFVIANRLRQQNLIYDEELNMRVFSNQEEFFQPSTINRLADKGYNSPRPIFIVAMPRSGTTLLEQALHSHPQIYGAGELDFLPAIIEKHIGPIEDLKPEASEGFFSTGTMQSIGEEYVQRMRDVTEDSQYITDKLPHNFLLVGFIRLALPNAKIVHMERNAIDTCLSNYKHLFGNNGHPYAQDLVSLGRYYNRYRELMEHWNKVFPEEFYTCSYENLVDYFEREIRKILDYCGIDWDDRCLDLRTADRIVRTSSATQVRQGIHKRSIESWKKYERQLQPLISILGNNPNT